MEERQMKNLKEIKKAQEPEAIEMVIAAYFQLDKELKDLEKRKADLRAMIEPHVEHMGGAVEVGEYKATVALCKRENFALAKAREAIREEILAPFISETFYNRLTVKKI
jgi:hypothetical protein